MSDTFPQYDLFLSYNSLDRDEVQGIRQQLGTVPQALTAFLDRESLTLGKRWFEEIESALLNSRAIAVFYGPHGLGRWQNLEMILALDLQAKPNTEILVIPVLLPGADLNKAPRFLLLNSYLDLRSGHDSTNLSRLAQHVLRQPTTLEALSVNDELRNPYRGLNYFQEQDAPLFFGRQYESQKLLEKVKTSALIALVGNSGTGKSSLVRAGLIPLLRKQHTPDPTWEVLVCIPALDNANPFHNLAAAFLESWGYSADEIVKQRPGIEATLRTTLSLVDSIRQTLKKTHNADKLLLIIDQFEELLNFDSLSPETVDDSKPKPKTEFELFVELLLNAANTDHCSVLLTIRGDYYGAVTERHAGLAEKIEKGTVTLSRLQDSQLRDIIVKPAQLAGGRFEDGLPERIIDDVGKKPGNLALLEFALTSLWNHQSQGWLKLSAYQTQVGKLEGAISAEADKILQSDKVPDQALALAALARLVRVSSTEADGGDTRQRVPLTEFSAAEKACLTPFIKSHLLLASGTWNGNEDAEQQPGNQQPTSQAPTLEVAHEALIRHWPTLQDALKDKRELLVWRQTIRRQYEGWKPLHDAGVSLEAMDKWLLKQGIQLDQALTWMEKRSGDLIDEEKAFIADSKKFEATAELRRWRKKIRPQFAQWQRLDQSNLKQNINAWLLNIELLQQGQSWLRNSPQDLLDGEPAYIEANRVIQVRRIKMRRTIKFTLFGCAIVLGSIGATDVWLKNRHTTWPLAAKALSIRIGLANPPLMTDMKPIPAGQFMMGTGGGEASHEYPPHTVTINAFKMGVTEVTIQQYRQFAKDVEAGHYVCEHYMASNPSKESKKRLFGANQPAIDVSWYEAQCYSNWLSFLTGKGFHLPTEAQWEYAARGNQGKTTAYFWGNSDASAKEYAWYGEDFFSGSTHPVGQLKANDFGLKDMAGNVREWTQDCWHVNYQNAPQDGKAWLEQNNGDCVWRVLRGGSWTTVPFTLRSALRDRYGAVYRGDGLGFRLAQDLP
jgi:formylglycine-generating enzyme required for sulfatase activity